MSRTDRYIGGILVPLIDVRHPVRHLAIEILNLLEPTWPEGQWDPDEWHEWEDKLTEMLNRLVYIRPRA
jgi:hypothetical protein